MPNLVFSSCLSILFFVRCFRAKELGGPTGLNYALGLLFGALAMASKSSTAGAGLNNVSRESSIRCPVI